jgi:hypothetical protein
MRKLIRIGAYSALGAAAAVAERSAVRERVAPAARAVRDERVGPLLVVGGAFVLGVAVAKWIDWRGHAHPHW